MRLFKLIGRLIILLIVFGLLGFGVYTYFFSPNDYYVSHQNYQTSVVDSNINGIKVAFISDINITNQESVDRFKEAIASLNENPFDLILFGGDLYDSSVINENDISDILKSIDCKYGKFAVLGEKDQNNSLEVTQVLNEGGFEVLENEVRTLYYKDSTFSLIATDQQKDISELTYSRDTLSICLTHQPDTFTNNKGKVDLQLSGHSLGGNPYVPFYGPMFDINGAKTYNHGTYHESESSLIVSNGLTPTASFPYKVFSRNQMIIITINNS